MLLAGMGSMGTPFLDKAKFLAAKVPSLPGAHGVPLAVAKTSNLITALRFLAIAGLVGGVGYVGYRHFKRAKK